MIYTASVKNKETKKIEVITSDYPNKKAFAFDLRRNGYSVRFISTEKNFDHDCEKYYEKLEAKRVSRQTAEPETAETEPTEDTADQGETSESVTKQYECENVVQVAHKVADLTNTLIDRQTWKGYCDEVKRYGSTWIDYTAFDTGGNEFDVSIFLGYDQQCRHYFVSVDYEKCPVPDMSGGA